MGRQEALDEAFTKAEKTDPNEAVKSVYLGLDLAEEIDALADEWNRTPSSVMRWLIQGALDKLASGELDGPTLRTTAELG